MRRLLLGRYGSDSLNMLISILSLIILFVSMLTGWTALYALSLALIAYSFYRMFSKNIYKRSRENQVYLRQRGKIIQRFSVIKQRFSQRKTHHYYKCPSCRKQLRVPKGRGRVAITCPQCRTSFEKRT